MLSVSLTMFQKESPDRTKLIEPTVVVFTRPGMTVRVEVDEDKLGEIGESVDNLLKSVGKGVAVAIDSVGAQGEGGLLDRLSALFGSAAPTAPSKRAGGVCDDDEVLIGRLTEYQQAIIRVTEYQQAIIRAALGAEVNKASASLVETILRAANAGRVYGAKQRAAASQKLKTRAKIKKAPAAGIGGKK